jgi:hypothetical protein
MSAGDIALVIGTSVQAATVILGIGRFQGCSRDIREDMREMRTSIQSFLLAQAALTARRDQYELEHPTNCPPQKGDNIE